MENKAIITVSQLNNVIKLVFDNEPLLRGIYVKGEISNFTFNHTSKHMYFTLKDKNSSIRVVAFRNCTMNLPFMPQNGMNIICMGSATVFEKAGQYQIIAENLEPEGVGTLALEFEKLKKQLKAEGLFELDKKKKIPKIPTSIGIITSPTGAAIRDIINVTARRHPLAHLYIKPVLVQGDMAAEQIAKAIDYFREEKPVDVIIVGRGGGSAEDLWAFNSPLVAHAIFNSHIPIISAVGHEIDFTIADFVADVRAATPSVAAEIATPDMLQLIQKFNNLKSKLTLLIEKDLSYKKQYLSNLKRSEILKNPGRFIDQKKMETDYVIKRFENSFDNLLRSKKQQLSLKKASLLAMSPVAVLKRGYSIASGENGKIISKTNDVNINDTVVVKLSNGSIGCVVNSIKEEI